MPLKLGVFTADDWRAYSSIFDALSGMINAIALALLIARLDSKLVGLPSWLISILYSYAAVQPLFMVFELSQSDVLAKRIAPSVLIFVFVSKIYFFLIITYALQTGKMLNYLFCFPILRERARERGGRRQKLMSVSGWLSSEQPLRISKWLGLAAIFYFFISLIGSQVFSSGTGGVQLNPVYDRILHILKPPDELIDWAQLVFVSLMVVTLFLVRNENRYGSGRALTTAERIFKEALKSTYPPKEGQNQVRKFKEYFSRFWCVTLLLYVVFLLDHKKMVLPSCERGLVVFSYLLYPRVLTQDHLCAQDSVAFMFQVLLFPFLKTSLGTLNLMYIFRCFVVLRSPAFDKRAITRQSLLVNYATFMVALLIALFPLLLFTVARSDLSKGNMIDYATVFAGVTGTLSAVVLALLIARMDSKLFGLPWWLIGVLLAYASIQPLSIAFDLKVNVLEMVQTSVLTAALVLKICFFLVVAHSLQSGKVLKYLVCFPFLKERVDSIFENQFEIRLSRDEHHSFTFSILKKNQLYYSTARRLKSRRDCDRFVRYLRNQMKKKGAYLPPREEAGTYWVELRSDRKKRLICESIPLKSEEEAQDLIAESIDKIPYCKYNRI